MRFEFEHFYWLCKPASTKCIGGIVASIAAFQAVDPASIPSQLFHKAWAEVEKKWGAVGYQEQDQTLL